MIGKPISRFGWYSAVLFLLLQAANALPLCGFKDLIQFRHPRVRLRFTLEGRPLPGANVELYLGKRSQTNDLPHETGVTDSDGVAVTSELPMAAFYIRVLSHDHQTGEFMLNAPLDKELRAVEGRVELLATSLTSAEENEPCCAVCSAVVEKTLQAQLRALRGVVVDPTGAVISKATIDVYKNEESKEVIAHLIADDAGRYDSKLASGKYLVVFKACGFDEQKVVVTLGADGWRGMQTGLGVGGSCGRRIANEASIAPLNWDSPENR